MKRIYRTVINNKDRPGIGRVLGGALEYTHSDMIGTLKTTSDSLGNFTANRVYTAFGEDITSNSDRYGYAGDWGYQSSTSTTQGDPYVTDFKYQHVGARYYDPSSGRFLQRDPIGVAGGVNVYSYVGSAPTIWVDPEGLGPTCFKHKECRDWNARFGRFPPKPESTQQELDRVNRRIKALKIAIACLLGILTGGVSSYTGAAVGGAAGAVGGAVSVAG